MIEAKFNGGPCDGSTRWLEQELDDLGEYRVTRYEWPSGVLSSEIYHPRRERGRLIVNAEHRIDFDYVGQEW